MVEHFIQHIRSKNLFDLENHYLLAISGGVDSVCLGYLLKEAGVRFSLLHYNFGLRGEESDGDEDFVSELAESWGVELFIQRASELDFQVTGKSIQMVARDLRYHWFEQIYKSGDYAGVVVAHHMEDQVETVLLNLFRGTGIEGIYGMAEKRDYLIRPLLPFKKSQLEAFMVERRMPWRIDSSNQKNIYKRNFIRNEVFPLLENVFPNSLELLEGSFQRVKDTGKAFFHLFDHWKSTNIKQEGDYQYLDIKSLMSLPGKSSMLYYWLRDYGFATTDIHDILRAAESGEVGKLFHSGEYSLNVDREVFILGKEIEKKHAINIDETDVFFHVNGEKYEILHLQFPIELDKSSKNAMIDRLKLNFPLEIRPWKNGDKMIPLGMKQAKKVSDILIDMKIPLIQKKDVKVLCVGEEIVWLIGLRISESFKCDELSEKIVYFKKV
ncbi:tRNA lysidine(34) synthetase TilS [Belliella kenyensis]|uniref:tRNA(Ile)-lysidine synthase n=1 Tax=Belliella kenyensis TaxID=1472724 RepID=A0ABV8EHK7_9BACT|nr:tRNA lysidine(34) synthetase TilS [Belliella kenyensis]MCH7402709.1 tRNA lysidine(34) synthetase TilS [Belliella kenyensis]MDN3603743.1 tRNA lysidine(34) synthetase TilS [Belliella kenyensis]